MDEKQKEITTVTAAANSLAKKILLLTDYAIDFNKDIKFDDEVKIAAAVKTYAAALETLKRIDKQEG